MAAPTNTYVDYGAGNDYKGTTFTDGAYTQATKNLNKTGAFTANQVNHWLYISGTHITTGYYKIATKTDNNNVVLATDASSDGNNSTDVTCTQADGTTSKPWRSIQGALDLITRDATNGNQVNVKAGTAQVNQAALVLTTYGKPADGAPLILRGYTSTANDGGMGEIDCGGFSTFAVTTSDYIGFIDLEMHTFGNNNGIDFSGVGGGDGSFLYHCEVHKGASSPSSKYLIKYFTGKGAVINCYVHDAGTSGVGLQALYSINNYVYNCPGGGSANSQACIRNIIVDCFPGIQDSSVIVENSIYSSTASTSRGIYCTAFVQMILNNVIEGYSGAGGKGIYVTADTGIIGYNAFFNNTANKSIGDVYNDLGGDAEITGATSPFTNAAGGDFSLNTAVAGAIDGAFPGAWYGPASTTDHADIGAVQNGAGAGGNVNLLRGKLG